MNKAGQRVRVLRGDKLPESTGDKLTAWGDGFQLSWGNRIGLSWGNFELHWGSDSIECLIYRRGTIFRPRLPGMLVKNICIAAGECLRSAGGYSISLIFDDLLGEECIVLLNHSLGN